MHQSGVAQGFRQARADKRVGQLAGAAPALALASQPQCSPPYSDAAGAPRAKMSHGLGPP